VGLVEEGRTLASPQTLMMSGVTAPAPLVVGVYSDLKCGNGSFHKPASFRVSV